MSFIYTKASKILVAIVSLIFELANAFGGNIIIYEVTEGINFNWELLLKNRFFWIILIIDIIYYAIPIIIHQELQSNDKKLEEAISNNSVKLVDLATDFAANGDFASSKKVLKILDKFQKRRRK